MVYSLNIRFRVPFHVVLPPRHVQDVPTTVQTPAIYSKHADCNKASQSTQTTGIVCPHKARIIVIVGKQGMLVLDSTCGIPTAGTPTASCCTAVPLTSNRIYRKSPDHYEPLCRDHFAGLCVLLGDSKQLFQANSKTNRISFGAVGRWAHFEGQSMVHSWCQVLVRVRTQEALCCGNFMLVQGMRDPHCSHCTPAETGVCSNRPAYLQDRNGENEDRE